MGLFCKGAPDAQGAKLVLDKSVAKFNQLPGIAYSIKAAIDHGKVALCSAAFDRIAANGFPGDPGPFKRLGAFAAFAQMWCPFVVEGTLPAEKDQGQEGLIWGPRLVVWTLPFFARALEVNGGGKGIETLALPTPHFQVEFIAYLRNMAYGVEKHQTEAEDALLLERATATGLILEASAYIPPRRGIDALSSLHSHAEPCMEAIAADETLKGDFLFNDRAFLQIAVGMGFEN